jgi:hypothetical protein
MQESAKVVSGVAVSTRERTNHRKKSECSAAANGRDAALRRPVVAARRPYLALAQRLSWRAFAVRKNLSNRRRKVINAGTGHDDAVAAAVSFLGNAQESPAVVLAEFHVEMLALNLQFSRLDDVIHFSLRPPTLPQPVWGREAKSAGFLGPFRSQVSANEARHW